LHEEIIDNDMIGKPLVWNKN